jgi:uncharacterized membrane protein HdeD (DUF308 family)
MQSVMVERRNNGSIILGVLLIILGVIAAVLPMFAALVLIRVIAWLLIFAAFDQVIHAFRTSGEGGQFIKVFLAVLYAVAGVMLLSRPLNGIVAATAVIGFLLIADGIMEIALGVQLRRTNARSGWLFAGGVLSLFLGALILYRLPWSMVAVGLLVGIRLIFKGIEQIARSSATKRAQIIERRAA